MKITLQHIFNLAWQRFIVEQAGPCTVYNEYDKQYGCTYSDGEGGHCAVGLALPEELKACDQTRTFPSIVDSYIEWFDVSITTMEESKLRRFQCKLHDDLVNLKTGTWKLALSQRVEKYKTVARNYGLEVPVGS